MANKKCLRVCETCPWLIKNHNKQHDAGWYKTTNLRRLWAGLRTGNAPGMICHSSDPNSAEYGGKPGIKAGQEKECAGALTLIIANVNAVSKGVTQPHQPPLSKRVIADYVWRYMTSQLPAVEDRHQEIGLPWTK